MSRRVLPKRLEDDLKNAPKYNVQDILEENTQKLLDESEKNKYSVEKKMFDDLLGPAMKSRGSYTNTADEFGKQDNNGTGFSMNPNHNDKYTVEKMMYNDMVGSKGKNKEGFYNAVSESKENDKSKFAKNTNDLDFETTLLNRLTSTESALKSTRIQLADKLNRLDKLEIENQHLKDLLHSQQNNSINSQLFSLKNENINLYKQISEMEQFLADYGLVWVGPKHHDIKPTDDQSTETMTSQHIVPYERFLTKVTELNDLIKSEPMQVKTENTIGQIRHARLIHTEEQVENIPITFYRNGLMVRRGPFRVCGSDSYRKFVTDIVDGFFPSEFRNDCPDGVILNLKDKHTVDYVEGVTDTENQMTQQQLLSKIPKVVVRNGQVIHTRDEVEAKLKLKFGSNPSLKNGNESASLLTGATSGQSGKQVVHIEPLHPSVTVSLEESVLSESNSVTSAAAVEASEGAQIRAANESEGSNRLEDTATNSMKGVTSSELSLPAIVSAPPSTASPTVGSSEVELATVQVRWLQGSQVLVIKVPVHGTVGSIHSEIKRHFGESCPQFELRSAYPPRVLPENWSLEKAELRPNGTVHAKSIE